MHWRKTKNNRWISSWGQGYWCHPCRSVTHSVLCVFNHDHWLASRGVYLWRTVFLGWIWICSGISSLRIYLCSCTLPFENNHCKWGILRLFSLSFNCTFSYIFKTMFWNNREIYLFLPSHTFSKQSFNNREKLRFIFLDKCICFGFKLFCISDPGCLTYFT